MRARSARCCTVADHPSAGSEVPFSNIHHIFVFFRLSHFFIVMKYDLCSSIKKRLFEERVPDLGQLLRHAE